MRTTKVSQDPQLLNISHFDDNFIRFEIHPMGMQQLRRISKDRSELQEGYNFKHQLITIKTNMKKLLSSKFGPAKVSLY